MSKWRQRVKDDPTSAEGHYALGLSYLNGKLRDAAIEHLRKAVLLAPELADIHYSLAIALFNDGDILTNSAEMAEATKEIDVSLRLAPDFAEAAAFRCFFIGRAVQDVDPGLALQEYQKAISYCSDIASFHNNAGLCLINQKKPGDAIPFLSRAIALDDSMAMAYSNLCLAHYLLGKYSDGATAGNKAVELMGNASAPINRAYTHNNLGLCLWKLKRKAEAVAHIQKAIAIQPGIGLFHSNLKNVKGGFFGALFG